MDITLTWPIAALSAAIATKICRGHLTLSLPTYPVRKLLLYKQDVGCFLASSITKRKKFVFVFEQDYSPNTPVWFVNSHTPNTSIVGVMDTCIQRYDKYMTEKVRGLIFKSFSIVSTYSLFVDLWPYSCLVLSDLFTFCIDICTRCVITIYEQWISVMYRLFSERDLLYFESCIHVSKLDKYAGERRWWEKKYLQKCANVFKK